MNLTVLIIILILTVIAAVFEYSKEQDYKAVIVLVVGIIISVLAGFLLSDKPTESDVAEYEQYCTEKRNEISNATRNREYDLVLDLLMQLANETEAIYGDDSLELGNLYAEVGQVHRFLSDSSNAKKYVGYAKNIVLKHVPDEDNYLEIAQIYKACGDAEDDIIEREFFYNRALDIMDEFNDTSGQLTANICANFSDAYTQVNDYVHALEYAERARNLYEKKIGTSSREAGIMYCSLGNIYTMRNQSEALKYYKQAEEIFKNNAPDDDSFLAICYSGMANLYTKIDQEDCYKYAFEAWNINKSIFGELHENTIKSEIDMAVFYRANGDKEQAKLRLEDAFVKAEEKYNDSKLMATVYLEMGNIENSLQKSLFNYDKAEAILKDLYGENHLDLAYVYSNKSVTYYLNDDFVNAKKYYNYAVRIYEDKGGSFSPDLAELYLYMGDVYYEENDFTTAINMCEKAQKIFDTLYGNVNINSARCKYKIARIYSSTGEIESADTLFKQSIDIFEMTYGEYSAQNADLYMEYAWHIYRVGGDINIAIDYAQKAVDFSSKDGRGNSIEQRNYCFILGNLYIEADYKEKGIEYLQECVRIAEYNDYIEPTYIQALCALAQQYSTIDGGRDTAIQYIDRAIIAATEAGDHDDLCSAYYHTSVAYGNLREYEKALEFLEIAEQEGSKMSFDGERFIRLIKDYREYIINLCKG